MRSRRRAGSSHRLGDFRNIRGLAAVRRRPAGSLCLPGRGPSGLLVDIVDRISENQLRKVVVDLDRRTIARPELVDRFGGDSVCVAPWAYEVQLDEPPDEFGRPFHQLRPADFNAREDRLSACAQPTATTKSRTQCRRG